MTNFVKSVCLKETGIFVTLLSQGGLWSRNKVANNESLHKVSSEAAYGNVLQNSCC